MSDFYVSIASLESVLLLMAIWSYIMIVCTDPGTVPPDFNPDTLPDELKLTYSEDFDELTYKEARAKYCKQC